MFFVSLNLEIFNIYHPKNIYKNIDFLDTA
jgi:hypothetical protein